MRRGGGDGERWEEAVVALVAGRCGGIGLDHSDGVLGERQADLVG
jgi:hypothetical protein